MSIELGHFAYILSFFVALIQAIPPLVGAHKRIKPWALLATNAAGIQFLLVAIATGSLLQAYGRSDFSVWNVLQNSHQSDPLLYKLCALWGNHEGSMLLGNLVLASFGLSISLTLRNTFFKSLVLSFIGWVNAAFLLFSILTSNPFLRLPDPSTLATPPTGMGFNPVLQDMSVAFHPPILYVGYLGMIVPWAMAMAALWEGPRVRPYFIKIWLKLIRPWVLWSWVFLTAGIAWGSWWAYYELGWGGWWFWDPVENASLIPWLLATALLHTSLITKTTASLQITTIGLALATFISSLFGMFLVRSGLLSSVHTFASDPSRGAFLLAILLFFMLTSGILFGARLQRFTSLPILKLVSREGIMAIGVFCVITVALTVILGTIYPLLIESLTGDKLSVGAPYFNLVCIPIGFLIMASLAVAPHFGRKREELHLSVMRLQSPLIVTLGIATACFWYFGNLWLTISLSLSIGIFVSLIKTLTTTGFRTTSAGMLLGHLGIALLVAGATIDNYFKEEVSQVIRVGESFKVGQYTLTLKEITHAKGPNFDAIKASISATTPSHREAYTLTPERRLYHPQETILTETALHNHWLSDLYVILGQAYEGDFWTIRTTYHPWVKLIWLGAGSMALGGLVQFCILFWQRRQTTP